MRDTTKNPNADLPLKDKPMETGVRNQGKRKTLFARRTLHEGQSPRAVKLKVRLRPPGRRCYRMMESCLPSMHCCDPCAICNCRFFNTVCYCWKLEQHCHEKS
ncbi:agouti-related protein-like isoform X2 [Anguilla anguilla]|nr:agouti-related protein-like isoform X2 [Anguilla anguilla]